MPPTMPPPSAGGDDGVSLQLPSFLRDPFSAAMAQSVLLPAFIGLLGIVAALFLVGGMPRLSGESVAGGDDDVEDDDAYVELILLREPEPELPPVAPVYERRPDRERVLQPRAAPARRGEPVRRVPDRPVPRVQPIGLAHNGSRVAPQVDAGRRLRPIAERPTDRPLNGPPRHHGVEGQAPRGQHRGPDPDDDSTGHGRHSSGR